MINSHDVVNYKSLWFDSQQYIKSQTQAIEERMQEFAGGRLYLEIGWKFLYDAHAARVLPGFDPECKKYIFQELIDQAEVLFCVNSLDIERNRQLSNTGVDYVTSVYRMIDEIEQALGIKPHVVMNMMDPYALSDELIHFQRDLQRKGYRVWERYSIDGYPEDIDTILSEDGFGQDDHIPLTQNLVLVTGAASNSGKMSTCMWQIYQDNLIDIKSGYAKYETFPVRNLDLDHPINLAYEAATIDIGDYNCRDELHIEHHDIQAVNYNRDVEAFGIVSNLAEGMVQAHNYMRKYKSPTDMGINMVGYHITNDEVVCVASYQEIQRRKERYTQIIDRGHGDIKRLEKCDRLLDKCKDYMKKHNYSLTKKL